jgi:transposase
LIEEWLFESRRDLFSPAFGGMFFDTTSIYFEGDGGETIGQYGNSKDKRPDLKQMIVGVVVEESGRPLCCELWPGNTTDVKTLIPVVDRLRTRFHIGSLCVVADRGMISAEVMERLKEGCRNTRFILGVRMRAVGEVRDEVLSRGGEYQVVYGARKGSKDPAPLKVKEVFVEGRRYVVCHNEEEAEKDPAFGRGRPSSRLCKTA